MAAPSSYARIYKLGNLIAISGQSITEITVDGGSVSQIKEHLRIIEEATKEIEVLVNGTTVDTQTKCTCQPDQCLNSSRCK
jgi:hypothetical protein